MSADPRPEAADRYTLNDLRAFSRRHDLRLTDLNKADLLTRLMALGHLAPGGHLVDEPPRHDPVKVGALFAGYGGIELALNEHLHTDLRWYAEWDKPPASIMAHHHPDVPNLWDVTSVDWAAVEPVDVITGGSPCQDLSSAGKRAGMKAGTRSGLWASMCDAIDIIRPALVVWENVRGALSAEAASGLEPCPGCVGDGTDEPHLRALGRVLGDLADIGYDARWYGLRAADVGAPHSRWRVFVFATPRDGSGLDTLRRAARAGEPVRRVLSPAEVAAAALLPTPAVNDMGDGKTLDWWDEWAPRQMTADGKPAPHGKSLAIEAQRLLPTPTSSDKNGSGRPAGRTGGDDLRTVATSSLLPTLTTSDYKGGHDAATRTGGPSLTGALLPTPQTMDAVRGKWAEPATSRENQGRQVMVVNLAADPTTDWGNYGDAIQRWAAVTGRPAPAPTEISAGWLKARERRFHPNHPLPAGMRGSIRRFLTVEYQLAAAFPEWMMGLPAGHITDTPGLTRANMLKAAGNGVVPQQCAAALDAFLDDEGIRPGRTPQVADAGAMLPTPRATRGGSSTETANLLPIPTASDPGGATTHKGGNPTLNGAILGIDEKDQQRHARLKAERRKKKQA